MLYVIILSLILNQSSVLSGLSATQTSWSGFSGVTGPVTSWGTSYSYSVSTVECGGKIMLEAENFIINDSSDGIRCVCGEDMDLDGDTDVIGAVFGTNQIVVYVNNGTCIGYWPVCVVDSYFDGVRSVDTADFNDDGYPDIAAAGYGASQIAWWQNPGNMEDSWTKHYIEGQFQSAWTVHAADIDGDERTDVVGSSGIGVLCWWEAPKATGTGWETHTIGTNEGSVRAITTDDLDGDGDTDIIIVSYSRDEVIWYENTDGSGSSLEKHLIGTLDGPHSVRTGDIDLDGDADIALCGYKAKYIGWYENDVGGTGDWVAHTIRDNMTGARDVYLSDMDEDGDLDLTGVTSGTGLVGWWENNGTGSSWNEHFLSSDLWGAYSVYVGDIGSGGGVHVISGSHELNRVSAYSLELAQNAMLESSILYLESDPEWGEISWDPVISGVSVQVRASDNPSLMGAWSSELVSPSGLSGLLNNDDSYFQYRVFLASSGGTPPEFHDITVSWDAVGVEDCSEPIESDRPYLSVMPNPVEDSGSVFYSIPVSAEAEADLFVYDSSGRVMWSRSFTSLPGELNSTILPAFPPGIYHCRLTVGAYCLHDRFVVVK